MIRSMRATVRNEHGIALVVALVVILILTGIILAVTQITTSELETHRTSRWDDIARYLADAGVEHQIYLLKADQSTCGIPTTPTSCVAYTNYPVLPGETAGSGAFWYRTTLQCITNCTGRVTDRVWWVTSSGEVRQCCWTILQQRQIRANVEITYLRSGGNNLPQTVTFLRWEEVYP